MLNVKASEYVRAGEVFKGMQEALTKTAEGSLETDGPISSDDARVLGGNLGRLNDHCERLKLPVTQSLIQSFLRLHTPPASAPSRRAAHIAITGIINAFRVELETQLFLCVLPHRTGYYNNGNAAEPVVGTESKRLLEALAHFPDVHFDAP